jgi:predicted restriction endonuclease
MRKDGKHVGVDYPGVGKTMSEWLKDTIAALENLGGIAHYERIYDEVKKLRADPLPKSWKKIIQRKIQDHSADSVGYKADNIFYSVEGIGSGVWGLRSRLSSTPSAFDIGMSAAPDRLLIETYRILRDTELARKIKALHKNVCQICGETIALQGGLTYAEAHHIQPIGNPHNGPDIAENIIVLCPNHHVLLDYLSIPLKSKHIRSTHGHIIGSKYIDYHNKQFMHQSVGNT